MNAVRVTVSDTLAPWQPSWDALVDAAPVPTPFLRSWWLEGVADARARFVLITDRDRLVGGLALEQHRSAGVPILRACGSGALRPDHVDVLADAGREQDVIASVVEWFGRPGARAVDVSGVVQDSLLSRVVGPHALTPIAAAPWEPLPRDPEEYLRRRSVQFRRSMRSDARRLTEGGVSFGLAEDEDTERMLDAFAALLALLPQQDPLIGEWSRLRRALVAGAHREEVRFYVARHGAAIVAITVAFVVAGRLSLYRTVCRHDREYDGVSTLVDLTAIANGCVSGCTELDMLRGDAAYTPRFASSSRTVSRARWGTGGAGRAWVLGAAGLESGSSTLRRMTARTAEVPQSVDDEDRST